MSEIDSKVVRSRLTSGDEIAFIDVREEGQHGMGHPLLTTNVPYSRLELDIGSIVPRRDVPIILIDDNDGIAAKAAQRLRDVGYAQVDTLKGGVKGWADSGYELFLSTNVPSKAFAEVVEHVCGTPSISPQELNELFQQHKDVVLLDCRTEEEFARFHVPGALSCPGAELVRRFDDLVPNPDSFVVVSCAGRTRGIMGAQSLINAGVPNRVASLRGGTPGWLLASFKLEDGPAPAVSISDEAIASATQRTHTLAERFGVSTIDAAALAKWEADPNRTVHLFDVRTPKEFAAGHRPGAISVPGGQLVHTIDRWVGTRNARVVLADDNGVRARMTAHWLKQMGWDVAVLDGKEQSAGLSPPAQATPPRVDEIEPEVAQERMKAGAAAVSADVSADYRRGHPAGAVWANRARLHKLPASVLSASEIVVFSSDGRLAHLAALDLRELTKAKVAIVRGGVNAWKARQLPMEASPDKPTDDERLDFLFWNHDRQAGNPKSMSNYLHWEAEVLPPQIERDGTAGFQILHAARPAE